MELQPLSAGTLRVNRVVLPELAETFGPKICFCLHRIVLMTCHV